MLYYWAQANEFGLLLGLDPIGLKQMSFFFFFYKLGRYDQILNNNNVDNNDA